MIKFLPLIFSLLVLSCKHQEAPIPRNKASNLSDFDGYKDKDSVFKKITVSVSGNNKGNLKGITLTPSEVDLELLNIYFIKAEICSVTSGRTCVTYDLILNQPKEITGDGILNGEITIEYSLCDIGSKDQCSNLPKKLNFIIK